MSQGYSLELWASPYPFFIQSSSSNDLIKHNLIQNEISHLLNMGVIENVLSDERFSRFFSIFSIVQKCMGGVGRVGGITASLNLKRHNKWIKKMKFCVETLASKVSPLSQEDFFTSGGLVNAYPHIPNRPCHCRLLRFIYAGNVINTEYSFSTCPWPPRIFTKMVVVIIAILRSQGIHLYSFLDDILIRAPSPQQRTGPYLGISSR